MSQALKTQAPHSSENAPAPLAADEQIAADAALLSAQLAAMRDRFFPPTAQKTLRAFSSGEAAKLIGVSDGDRKSVV